jgi:Tol biopolymer transport system component
MRMKTTQLAVSIVIGLAPFFSDANAQTVANPIRVMVSWSDSTENIYRVGDDGTLGENLTHSPEGHGSWIPSFSPDCRRIVFASNRDDGGGAAIYVMAADGSNIRQLTRRGGRDWDYLPVFSPDGNRILYIATVDDKRTIWVMDADGSNPRRFSDTPGESWYSITDPWSRDGSSLLFHSTWETGATVRYQPDVRLGGTDLFLADPDGSNVRRLTQVKDTTEFNVHGIWSPDGTEILFESKKDGEWTQWIMDADGSNQRKLTHIVGEIRGWSPDGRLFVVNRGGDVYVTDVQGESVQRLTTTAESGGRSGAIRWTPWGIEFFSNPDGSRGNMTMFVMDPDGTNVRLIGPLRHHAVCAVGYSARF